MNFDPSIPKGMVLNFENYESPISQETALACFLLAIKSYSEDGSYESRKAVLEQAKNFPDFPLMPEKVQEALKKIKIIAESKNWDPTLSPTSTKLFDNVCRSLTDESKQVKPSCAKKLNFF